MSSSGKDPITCHVLDTTAGRPAKGVRVRLEGPSFASTATSSSSATITSPTGGATASSNAPGVKSFEAFTDDDGRVKVWLPYSSETSAGEVPVHTLVDVLANVSGPSRWTLRFDSAGYFGEEATFFPEATVVFRVDEGQHYHVPLLLSPYSYTTYRGS
jgi:5-hydroxyisourate hydrolase